MQNGMGQSLTSFGGAGVVSICGCFIGNRNNHACDYALSRISCACDRLGLFFLQEVVTLLSAAAVIIDGSKSVRGAVSRKGCQAAKGELAAFENGWIVCSSLASEKCLLNPDHEMIISSKHGSTDDMLLQLLTKISMAPLCFRVFLICRLIAGPAVRRWWVGPAK